MACVWRGLIAALKIRNMCPIEFCAYIKSMNRDTPDMMWMGETLSEQLQKENKEHIDSLNPADVTEGYLCSTCDPLLLLVGQIYSVSINHLYLDDNIIYTNRNAKTKIYVVSTRLHFSIDKKQMKKQKKQDKKDNKRRKKNSDQ